MTPNEAPLPVKVEPALPAKVERSPTTEQPQHRGRRWLWLVPVVLLIAAVAGVWYWSTRGTEPAATKGGRGGDANRPMPVVAVPARKGNIDVYLNALGT